MNLIMFRIRYLKLKTFGLGYQSLILDLKFITPHLELLSLAGIRDATKRTEKFLTCASYAVFEIDVVAVVVLNLFKLLKNRRNRTGQLGRTEQKHVYRLIAHIKTSLLYSFSMQPMFVALHPYTSHFILDPFEKPLRAIFCYLQSNQNAEEYFVFVPAFTFPTSHNSTRKIRL